MTDGHRAPELASRRALGSGWAYWAAKEPSRPALVVRDKTLSYGELDRRARIWAHALLDAVGGRAKRVGVFGSRSETAYVGVLAALASGAAFVPLNPTFPTARTRAMIERAQLDAIIVDEGATRQLSDVLAGLDAPPVLLPGGVRADAATLPVVVDRDRLHAFAPLASVPVPDRSETAYLLFTSGSTGVPKGVPVTHDNVLHFLDVVSRRYEVSAEDRLSQTFDQTFDLSVFDQFVAWENGACLYAMQPLDLLAPGRFAERHRLTIWFSVPSIAALMRKKGTLKPGVFPTLRWSLFCGEPLPRTSAEAWQAAAPHSVVENLYGPTELTIACFVHRWDPERSPQACVNEVVPIGVPYEGLHAVVLDEQRREVAAGEPGELCVSGPQTVPGYWRDPAKTEEQFVTLSDASDAPRFYRTGDRVRQQPNGEFVYLGRVDHQVKVLGHRVELAEIEAVLGRQPGVTQAVALGWPMVDGTAEGIVAFVVGTAVDAPRLIASARQSLPDYMAPRAVHVLDAMPMNANNKIDRPALARALASGVHAPVSGVESR